MKMFQVTDHATGEVENIEAESASIAGLAFQLEGRSVTIIPINDNPEVIMKDHEITTTNPKEGNKMATKPTYHIAFTGHRPDKIGGYDETSPKRFALRQEIQATLQRAVDKYSTTHQIIVISGGALGVDQDAARIAYQMNIPFIVAQPCKNHESKWFKESQIKYAKMLELAHEVVLVSDGTYDELGAKCMQDRNIWMVDHCDALIAVWDGTSGGTANCVKYALKVNKPIVYINPNNFGGEGGEPTSTPINPKEGPNMNVNPEPITKEVITMDTKPVNKTTNPIKEGTNMIKEYLVHTPSLFDSPTIGEQMVYSRIITNDPAYAFGDGKSVVIEETKPGGYHWFMLEHMFGKQSFAVNVTAYVDPYGGEAQLVATGGENKPADVIFGWADFDAEYMIRVKGHEGTKFSDLSEYGLSVGNSAKMTKRLTEIIRAARGGMVNIKGKHKMARILVLTHYDILDILPHLETEEIGSKTFDGISLITNDYAKKVYRANKHLSGKAKYRTLQDMDDRKVTNHTLRVVTSVNGKSGMIKGNVLSVSKEALLARLREFGMISSTQVVDIVTTVDNFKEELGTDGSWEIITLEPHHGPGMVKTNDQTLAQFWNIEGIFDPKNLLTEFKSVLDNSYNNLVEGKDIQWMQNIVAERVTNEAGKFAAITGGKVTSNMNKMIASLNELGLDIGVSQTLMFMRAQGIKKMFLSETKKEGFNWQANAREKKSFVFMPYAYRAYVMTKEVLWLAGYDIDLGNDESFYHEDTQTFCMSGKTWANVQGKLGGADLDDEIMIHERRYVRPDGTVNPLVAFLVRTPNDWAEFAILNLAEPGPAFLTDGDMPTIHAKDLAKFKQTSVAGKLPSATIGSDRPASAVWDWESSVYNYDASLYKNGGVGGQVKTKMLQYGINNAPFRNLPCANEDMIDALQQCKGTTADLEALVEWSVEATKQVLQSQPMDSYWWYSRNMFNTAKGLKKNHGLTWWHKPLSDKQSPIVQELMIPREEMVRETHQEMINFLNRNIMAIPELENIFDDKKQEMHYRKLINDLGKLFFVPKVRDEHGNVLSASKHEITRHMQTVAVSLLERMANYQFRAGSEQTNLHVLRMVRASYLVKQDNPGANYDRWLYTAANDSEVIMTDYFVRALTWFRG